MIKVKRLHHSGLPVNDLGRATDFLDISIRLKVLLLSYPKNQKEVTEP